MMVCSGQQMDVCLYSTIYSVNIEAQHIEAVNNVENIVILKLRQFLSNHWPCVVFVFSPNRPKWKKRDIRWNTVKICLVPYMLSCHFRFIVIFILWRYTDYEIQIRNKNKKQEVKATWQKAPHGGPIPRLGVTPGGRNLYHWIPGVGFPISVP